MYAVQLKWIIFLFDFIYCIFDMTQVAILPSEAGDGLEEQDSYIIYIVQYMCIIDGWV